MVGESIVEASIVENKMGESVTSGATLEPSVSFGRFENDSLSWEKWSSFSPNKYLEEVEKCSTPGSVAQKKAYFEAHYKKIAARKVAEQLEHENLMESAPSRLDESKSENHVVNNTGGGTEFGGCNGKRSRQEVKQEVDKKISAQEAAEQLEQEKLVESAPRLDESRTENHVENNTGSDSEFGVCNGERSTEEVKQEADVGSKENSTTFDGIKEDVVSIAECPSSLVEDTKEELSVSHSINTTESNDREKIMLLEEEYTSQKSCPVVKQPLEVDNENKRAPEGKNKNVKIKARNITEKKTPTKKDQTLAGTKKKVASPATKSSPISAPRLSRPTPTCPLTSASQPSSKKLNGTLLPRNKNIPVGEIRRTAPTSLHMSLSLGPANSSVSPASTRKSLIMEQMADKDIIKRAFKAFQANDGQLRSSIDDKLNGLSKVSLEVPEQKVGPSTPSKENEGLRKAADKRNTQRGQLETKFRSSGLGSLVPKKNVNAATSSVGLKSDERPEKRREFLKNLEQKSIARQAEKAQLSAKSKEKDGNLEKLKQNSHLNATPVRTYSKGGVSKSSQKEGVKNKVNLPSR